MKEDSSLSSKRGGSAIAFIIALLALSVAGFFVWREFDRRQKVKAAPLRAVTRFQPLGLTRCGNEERTLLEVTIFTGVTHQIRAQLGLAGMHIVNDRLYGGFAVEGQIGHCLHALAARFTHPLSGAPVEIRTRFPEWASFVDGT